MRKTLTVLLAVIALGLGNANHLAMTILPEEVEVPYSEDVERLPVVVEPGAPEFNIGKIDTVGGTTVDWLANGPSLRMITNARQDGIHVLWMHSIATQTTFPDRNMRYNFYEYPNRRWSWIDPSFMNSGVNVYTVRSGYGNLGVDPATSVATTVTHQGTSPLLCKAARDIGVGAGVFEYSNDLSGYLWPVLDMGTGSRYQVGVMEDPGRQSCHYTKIETWPNWTTPSSFATPAFPTHSTGTSKVSQKICMTWVPSTGPTGGFYRISSDGGTTWGSPQALSAPAAYGGDTTPSFHITGITPYYDKFDRLHLTAAVMPYVAGSGYVIPAGIWHWSPDNSPNWARIHRAHTNNLIAPVGYNAIFACRPTMGEDVHGNLYVAWEQFDSTNYQASTNRVRADIWYSRSLDNGRTWAAGVKITTPNTTTKRFPSIIDHLNNDTLYITYLVDLTAGFFVQGEGPVSNNPIVVQKLPVTLVGMEEGARIPKVEELTVHPNPSRGRAQLSYALPSAVRVELGVFDLAGREVVRLRDAYQAAGRHSIDWQAAGLSPGVYIIRLKVGDKALTTKLIMQ